MKHPLWPSLPEYHLMNTIKKLTAAMITLLLWVTIVCAQEQNSSSTSQPLLPVTAAATGGRLRFTAPSAVVQMRLEVYGSNGAKLFDNELRGGNVIDWLLQDGQAAPLAEGSYLCVVTVKTLPGKISQRIASVSVEKAATTLHPVEASQLTPQQAQAVGPIEDNASLVLLKNEEPQTTTVIAHTGEEGQITRGRGALSFRLGDFYNASDIEQMRLTAEGNLGIGTPNPQAKLDVAGRIRASEGLVFPDGSVQFSASRKTFGAASLRPGQSLTGEGENGVLAPDISGTGTTGKISKWQDGPAGVLNDSNITEVSGAIGVNGTPDTRFRLDVNGSTRIRGSNPGFNLEGLRSAGNIWLFQTVDDDGRFRLFGQDNVNPGVERFTIKLDTGNVGIGATAPTAKLDVGGAINTSTQYNIGGNRILSVAGNENFFAGLSSGIANTTGVTNAFIGNSAGAANTTGSSNSFVGQSAGLFNTTGSFNLFVGNLAGAANTTGCCNSFVGYQAGISNTTGVANSFVGSSSGLFNTTGGFNSIVGASAGNSNTTGSNNAFVGFQTGYNNTTGDNNSYFGAAAGFNNATGANNTIIGSFANVGSGALTFATALGAGAIVSSSNTLVLGRNLDSVLIPGSLNVAGTLTGNFTVPATNISGVLARANGGTGLGASGAAGNFLRSDGTNWTSSALQVSDIPGGSSNYIQNIPGVGLQSGSFNINGGGNANIFNATTQYNLGGNRVLSIGGTNNLFVGINAGATNTTGSENAFFGSSAGLSNTTGVSNAYFGSNAGISNLTGSANAFFGWDAGFSNTTGGANAFFGKSAGFANTTGIGNSFFGLQAGASHTTGDNNTMIGRSADVGASNLSNATAIGANTIVSQSNSLVLGNNADVGIGTSAPQQKLHVDGSSEILSTGTGAGFKFRDRASTSFADDWVWYSNGNVARLFRSGVGDLLTIQTNGNVGIGTVTANDKLEVNGILRLISLGSAGGTQLCRNLTNQISNCSSSRRYKQNIQGFRVGLSLIRQLRPVSFNWRGSNQADLGLVAEEVAKVEPLLTTTNDKGEIEGVKYDRVGVVLVNAVQEQQQQIEIQQKQLDEQKQMLESQQALLQKQQTELKALKILLSSRKSAARTIKPKK